MVMETVRMTVWGTVTKITAVVGLEPGRCCESWVTALETVDPVEFQMTAIQLNKGAV